jgi:hypothetical protein
MRVWLGWVNERSLCWLFPAHAHDRAPNPNLAAASSKWIRSKIKIMSRKGSNASRFALDIPKGVLILGRPSAHYPMNLASRILAGSIASLVVLVSRATLTAASPEARVTQIIRDVKLLPSAADARPAVVDDTVTEDTALRTGEESRSELTFPDLTITRLGADTIFSFSKAGRTAKVESGSILLRVPKDSRGGAIKTNTVTVAITGTTVIFETDPEGNSKLITLEGGARLSFVNNPRRFRNVRAGQMLDVAAGATTLPNSEDIDLDELLKTHPLITDFGPLPSQDLIVAVAQERQNVSRRRGIPAPPSPRPSATWPRRSPGPTPRLVIPTPTPSPRPSVTPTPRSPTPTPSPIPSVTPTPKSVTPTASPKRSPTPRPTPTPSPTSDYNNDSTQTPRPSPTRYRSTPTPPIVTPTPKPIVTPTPRPSPSRFQSIPPRIMVTPSKPTPSPFPILRSTPASSPQIRKRVSPTPNPRASPTPVNRTRVSPTLKKPIPTATPGIR